MASNTGSAGKKDAGDGKIDTDASNASITAPKPGRTAATPRKKAAPRSEGTTDPMRKAASTTASDAVKEQGSVPTQPKAPDEGTQSAPTAQAVPPLAQRMTRNIERIEALGHRLVAALRDKGLPNSGVEGPGPDLFVTAADAWARTLAADPTTIMGNQVNYWGETLKNYATAQMALSQGRLTAPSDDGPHDKRFANPLWQTNPFFSYVRRQYQINAEAMRTATEALHFDDTVARRRLLWLTGQIIDMAAPTNFLATNPDALEKAIETEGESLVKGLENLVRDVEQNAGEVIVSLADRRAFTVGENIGTAEGTVVHRTPLFEMIQYKPTTEQAHALPLLIFPPWINKFYILDLKPQNSLIRWLLDQGHTLFVISWKNPDASYRDVGMEDYVTAYSEAMDKVLSLTGQKKLNTVGYCIAGTTLSLALAKMGQEGDQRVKSATLFTTLTDFSEQGEFVSFLQNDFVDGIAVEVQRHGLLRAQLMSRTMSFLRANDLVWGPAIRTYMMGETPPAFDLLYWNGDSTNLPGKMAMQYLRGLCQENRFAGDGFDLLGHSLKLSDIKVPLCAIACESDHIAPWKDCWRGVAKMGSPDKTFILSESGHIAGIVNPPSKKKYGHYAGSTDFSGSDQTWRDQSPFHEGSWWPRWGEWLAERAGRMVAARDPGEGLAPAPGTYVHERAV